MGIFRISVAPEAQRSGDSHKGFLSFTVLMSSVWAGSPTNTDFLLKVAALSSLQPGGHEMKTPDRWSE